MKSKSYESLSLWQGKPIYVKMHSEQKWVTLYIYKHENHINLSSKLEDIKQELAVSRKTELTLESKYKKLKTKYGKYMYMYIVCV